MNIKERILAIRIIEKANQHPDFLESIGVEIKTNSVSKELNRNTEDNKNKK